MVFGVPERWVILEGCLLIELTMGSIGIVQHMDEGESWYTLRCGVCSPPYINHAPPV